MPRGEMVAADTGLDGIEADESDDELGESARLIGRRAQVAGPSLGPEDRPA